MLTTPDRTSSLRFDPQRSGAQPIAIALATLSIATGRDHADPRPDTAEVCTIP
jgi:hypothetical protein